MLVEYWKNQEATSAKFSQDGYLLTADMGYMDEEGYLFIVDRKNDMIISGGFNIYPGEVEEAIYTHPAVLQVVVIGVPDDE